MDENMVVTFSRVERDDGLDQTNGGVSENTADGAAESAT